MESKTTFTIPESPSRDQYLAEAIEIVRYAGTRLGVHTQGLTNESKKQREAIENLEKLQNESISFSPRLGITNLTIANFNKSGSQPSFQLQAQLDHNNFYQVSIPITLFPKSGWAFSRLECWIEFCPGETDPHNRPIIHDIFPDDVWTEILNFQSHLEVGIDENLDFKAVVSEPDTLRWKSLSSEANAKINLQIGGGTRLLAGPYSYRIKKADIRARGRGNVECFWRLDGNRFVDEVDVKLEVILMVPKSRKHPIHVSGKLRACHDFQVLTADLFKDWRSFFDDKIKTLFDRGVPISTSMEWKDIIKSAS